MNRFFRVAALVIVGAFVAGSASSAPTEPQPHRYPFDPVCPWGRIADGRGIIVRCLSPDEAQRLLSATPSPVKAPSPLPSTSASVSPSSPPSTDSLQAELLSVDVATGELPLAKKKLAVPLERYSSCVQNHGGLQGATGQVVVKFMVTERGRAEGAGVEKFQGVTETAARCIADVIDRRPTGTPEAPIVEATATIRIQRKANR